MISWSKVVIKAIEAGVPVKEVPWCGGVAGYQIGSQIVRHDGTGWYNEAQVDAAIASHGQREAA